MRYKIVLARVVLGNVENFGYELAADKFREGEREMDGTEYDSWSGTEHNLMDEPTVEKEIDRNNPAAWLLKARGQYYGRQYITCRFDKAYPAYIVTYEADAMADAEVTVIYEAGDEGAADA